MIMFYLQVDWSFIMVEKYVVGDHVKGLHVQVCLILSLSR